MLTGLPLPAWALPCSLAATPLLSAEQGLRVAPLNGVPALFRDGVAVPALMADPGAGGTVLRDGALFFDDVALQGRSVHSVEALAAPAVLNVRVVANCSYYDGDEGSKVYFGFHTKESRTARYIVVLCVRGGQRRLAVEKWKLGESDFTRPVDVPLDWSMNQPIDARLAVKGAQVEVWVDGKTVADFKDPEPLVPAHVTIGGYRSAGHFEHVRVEDAQGAVVSEDDFNDPPASLERWESSGGLETPRLNWAHAGIHLYTAECADLRANCPAPGEYDWQSVDSALERLARYDPQGLLLARVFLQYPPEWWVERHPDEIMHAYVDGKDTVERRLFPSFSSEPWREFAAAALRDLVRHLGEHPEGHRLAGMNLGAGHGLPQAIRRLF